MAISPILTAERLELRPFDSHFLTDRYVSWLNNKQTVRFSEQRHQDHTLETCSAYAQTFASGPSYFWAVVAHDVALGHIGNISATVDTANRVADLAIMIGEARTRGQRYGVEAWQRAVHFLLEEIAMRKVTAGTMAVNEPMLRIMRSTGMIEEGRRKRQFLLDGTEVDAVLFATFAG